MKFCITSYYGLREALLSAANSIRKKGHEVIDFPLFQYYKDPHDKTTDYREKFITYIKNNKVDIILWWYINIPCDDFEFICQELKGICKHFFFNWDEPFNWKLCELDKKAKFLDCAFITCEETTKNYVDSGAKKAVFTPPGYDENIHKLIDYSDKKYAKYDADISFCCTNLYTDEIYKDQKVKRKDIVDKIYEGAKKYGYTFKIYGGDIIKHHYPEAYGGFVQYEDTNIVFNMSKINLCTHVVGNKNKYINERVVLIAGSGGLLLVDDPKGLTELFEPNKDCVIIDYNDPAKQINEILANYENYIDIRLNLKEKSKNYTWDSWADIVCKEI